MKFEIDDAVLVFLRTQGWEDVTLDLEDIPTPCCVGRLPELKLSPVPPANPGSYRHFCVRGINIHIAKTARTQESLTFFLSGFGRFKKLEVAGVNLVL